MKKLLLTPLLFFPAIVAFIFENSLDSFTDIRLQNVVENILFGILLFSLVSLIKPGKIRTIIFGVTYAGYTIFTWLESGFFYLYETNFNASTVYILIESNYTETKEFLSTYFDSTLQIFTLCILVPAILIIPLLVAQFKGFTWFFKATNAKRVIAALAVTTVTLTVLKVSGLIVQNLPYLFVKTSIQYAKQSSEFDYLGLGDKVGSFKNSIRKRTDYNETYVVVIGESHSRSKMSLYGYDRPTNPRLESIKDELVLFDKVISPNTHTITSLNKALTFTTYQDSVAIKKASIVQLFNSVGFKTFWLSNQRPVGLHENLLTKISNAADESNFINISNFNKRTPYDGDLLEPLQEAINDDYSKKVIFLHLLGNHIDYEKRYPKEFEIFNTTADKHQDIEDIIDAYDNATHYNDYILSSVIGQLKQVEGDAFMLYFSDHGEEVYQTHDSFGHFEGEATQPMYDIPFFLWLSDSFKKHRPIRYRPYRRYMTDDLIHSIGHLANIKFEGYDARKSVFSIYFREKTRYIQGDINYDKLYE